MMTVDAILRETRKDKARGKRYQMTAHIASSRIRLELFESLHFSHKPTSDDDILFSEYSAETTSGGDISGFCDKKLKWNSTKEKRISQTKL